MGAERTRGVERVAKSVGLIRWQWQVKSFYFTIKLDLLARLTAPYPHYFFAKRKQKNSLSNKISLSLTYTHAHANISGHQGHPILNFCTIATVAWKAMMQILAHVCRWARGKGMWCVNMSFIYKEFSRIKALLRYVNEDFLQFEEKCVKPDLDSSSYFFLSTITKS